MLCEGKREGGRNPRQRQLALMFVRSFNIRLLRPHALCTLSTFKPADERENTFRGLLVAWAILSYSVTPCSRASLESLDWKMQT